MHFCGGLQVFFFFYISILITELTSFYWLIVNDQCHYGVLKMLFAIIYRMHVIRPPHMTLYLHLAAGDVIKSCIMYADIVVTVQTIF